MESQIFHAPDITRTLEADIHLVPSVARLLVADEGVAVAADGSDAAIVASRYPPTMHIMLGQDERAPGRERRSDQPQEGYKPERPVCSTFRRNGYQMIDKALSIHEE